jgi:hypothetical protein
MTDHSLSRRLWRIGWLDRYRRRSCIVGWGIQRRNVVSNWFYGSNKPIPLLRQRLDIARSLDIIIQRLSQLLDRRVQRVLKIDKRILRPQPIAQLLAGNEFAGLFKKDRQNFDWLAVKVDAIPVLTQFSGARV